MTKLNWNTFKAKFDGQESQMFELLAYHLFCDEYKIPMGIFRFKNQTGIETEPIQSNDKTIGFQAKYYETKISENKKDIIASIRKAKNKNPNLNKVLLYTNKEISESPKKTEKDPSYKTEIESIIKSMDVEIVWRVTSHLEIQLSNPSISYLSSYFFSYEKSRVDSLIEIDEHTKRILKHIHSNIKYIDNCFKIDRKGIIEDINSALNDSKTVIISGNGGTGKTAIVKDIYTSKCNIPFYIFKANELCVDNVNDIFSPYSISLKEFLDCHKNEKSKLIVIDSAERLSEIENNEPFKEFFASLFDDDWHVVFTTRTNYLDDLRFQLTNVYRLTPITINVESLREDELELLSQNNTFKLPPDIRLRQLIRNLFYLNLYLQYYSESSQNINYLDFKTTLWKQKIQNASCKIGNLPTERENCFLILAKERSETGNFYSKAEKCQRSVLALLEKDEIIEYNSNNSGFFITHDIYEEWALDLLIEKAFQQSQKEASAFLTEIGLSLPIRRAFRIWVSDKIINQSKDVEKLIEDIINSHTTTTIWKDEIFTSVLLSDLSISFFNEKTARKLLLKENYHLLKRVIFILRIACKEANEPILRQPQNERNLSPSFIFTKPKGKGWEAIINLIYEELNSLNPEDLLFIFPLLKDWTSEHFHGHTTKKASLIALKTYLQIEDSEYKYRYSDLCEVLIEIIINGSQEITIELKELLTKILSGKYPKHKLPYEMFYTNLIENSYKCIHLIKALPDETIKVINFLWYRKATKEDLLDYGMSSIEASYSLHPTNSECFPASAWQTPIYWLLNYSPLKTLDFIISFTNKTVESYHKSRYGSDVSYIDIHLNSNSIQKQLISNSLWQMHRGTGSPVTPYLLQSIHMALEKHLLDLAEGDTSGKLTDMLVYLITHSKSASVTSVVASIVKAYPDKYFEVALILFNTIELFSYDIMLALSEREAKSIYSMGFGLTPRKKIYERERIETLNDTFRKKTLENIAINYQFIQSKDVNIQDIEDRRKKISAIIDKHHKNKLNDKQRLLLTRIDFRKIKPKIEHFDNKTIIEFTPEIEPELKITIEKSQKVQERYYRYKPIGLWSRNKFENKELNIELEHYDSNIKQVFNEMKEMFNANSDSLDFMDYSTPSFISYELIKNHLLSLTKNQILFCKKIVLQFSTNLYTKEYSPQISDGVEVAIHAIPYLYRLFPNETLDYNFRLLIILYDNKALGEYKRICDYSIESIINALWEQSSNDAMIIIYSYLKTKPLLNNYLDTIISNKSAPLEIRKSHVEKILEFAECYNNEILDTLRVNLKECSINTININSYSISELETVIQLIPNNTTDKNLIEFIHKSLPKFCLELSIHTNDYNSAKLRIRFYKKICRFILLREPQDVTHYIKAITATNPSSKQTKLFLEEFISANDYINRYEQFWIVWEGFYNLVVDLSKKGRGNYERELIYHYLLAWPYWREDAKTWHSLKEENKVFYKRVIMDIGNNIYVLDAIAQILNQIGSNYLEDGILWISYILKNNTDLWKDELGVNTIYYLELTIRKYLFVYRTDVRINSLTKEKVIIILNFMIEKGSVNAYLLREEIL